MKRFFAFYILLFATLTGFGQKQFTHVASRSNNSCNGDCTLLNVPELDDNQAAIIWVKAEPAKGEKTYPHPVGLYYFKNKWSIFNLDQKAIPAGSTFTVMYVDKADDTHFQYSIAQENMQMNGSVLIDHPWLNNNPGAQFEYFPSWNPTQRGIANRDSVTVQYNTENGKWLMSNVNGKQLITGMVYNIVMSARGKPIIPTINNAVEIKELTITPTGPSISGPLVGMYMDVVAGGVKLPGDNSLMGSPDKTRIWGFQLGASKDATGKSVYEPVTIKIRSGVAAAIPLLNAFVNKQGVVLTIDTYTLATTGKNSFNYSIRLSGVKITGVRQVYEELGLHYNSSNGMTKQYYDEIRITFTNITYVKDGVTVEDIL